MAASSSLRLPTLPDNPRAVGAAPFSKRELVASARTVQFRPRLLPKLTSRALHDKPLGRFAEFSFALLLQ